MLCTWLRSTEDYVRAVYIVPRAVEMCMRMSDGSSLLLIDVLHRSRDIVQSYETSAAKGSVFWHPCLGDLGTVMASELDINLT